MPGPLRIMRFLWLLAVLAASPEAYAQINVLQKEIVTREVSLFLGAEPEPPRRELVARELSLFIGAEPEPPFRETFARELTVLVSDTTTPARITGVQVDLDATGSTTTLDWQSYNEYAEIDVVRYEIYQSHQPFSDVTSMSPVAVIPAETRTFTFTGLPPWVDRYFAVVAVDPRGAFDPVVDYRAAIALQPEIHTREISLFLGAEPDPPARHVTAREISMALSTPAPPAPVTNLDVAIPPLADAATLDWSGYNEWSQHDIVRYDVYMEESPFTDIAPLSPAISVPAETFTATIGGLAPRIDRYFAIVAVDALGGVTSTVQYRAGIALQPELVTRELSLFFGSEPQRGRLSAVARELSFLLTDPAAPAPVTFEGSPFSAATSTTTYAAVELDWAFYNEWAQHDVHAYRIYTGETFFDDITARQPYASVPAETRRLTLQGLDGNTVYHVAVVAEDILGNLDPTVHSVSAISSIATVGDVENLRLTSCGAGTLTFAWTLRPGAADFLDHYRVYFAGALEPEILPPGATSYTASGLAAANAYPFRLTTVDRFANESGGSSLTGVTFLPNPSLAPPCAGDRSVALSWAPVEPAWLVQQYAVYVSDAPITSVADMSPVLTTAGTFATVTGLTNQTPYHFAVATVNLSGCTDPLVTSATATPHGAYAAWTAGFGLADESALPQTDANRNGIPNYLSYAFQIPPVGETTPQMRGWLPRSTIDGDTFTFEFDLPVPLPAGVTYEALVNTLPDPTTSWLSLALMDSKNATWQASNGATINVSPGVDRTTVRITSPYQTTAPKRRFEHLHVYPSPAP